jgi:hypothetical protein
MGWVVWDTSYLDSFFTTIKSAIGNATNIGLLIFAILVSIAVALRIVKMFSK